MLADIVLDALAAHGVAEYEVMECDPSLADTAAFCEAYDVDPAESANTILVASKRPPGVNAACVVLATHRLDVNRVVRSELGVKKLSFASAELTVELTTMQIGGVTPFGLPTSMPVLVDGDVLHRDSIVLGGGNRSSKLRIAPKDLLTIPSVEVIAGLAAPF